jgi:hypothetical protein
MAYRVPGIGIGFSTILIAVGLIPASFLLLAKHDRINYFLIFLLLLYFGYVITKVEGNNFLLPIAIIIHIAAISTGVIKTDFLRTCLEKISILASVCVLLQQTAHLFLDVHIPMMFSSLLLEDLAEHYSSALNTGYGIENIYRPSAFFLEPSHFSQYCIYGLGSFLFRPIPSFRSAMIVSLGFFSTTSGMGFVLVFGIWSWWALFYRNNKKNVSLIPKLFFLLFVLLILFFILMQIPFFEQTVNRFTGGGDSDYNAIDGRLFFWTSQFGDKTITDLIYGFGEEEIEEGVYFTGFMKILFAYGIIGLVLFFIFIIYLIFYTQSYVRFYAAIYLALLFLANLIGFIAFIFNIGVILSLHLQYLYLKNEKLFHIQR